MGAWREEKLYGLKFIDNDHALVNKIGATVKELEFDYYAFVIRTPLPISSPATFAATNASESWQNTYQLNNYVSIDPIIKHGTCSQEMLVWSDKTFAEVPDFRQAAQAEGLCHGVSIPTRGNHGVIGILSMARPAGKISAAELEEKKFKLIWLAQIAHQEMTERLAANFFSAIEPKLSRRELSVLRWTAEGKTSEEIAEVLKISERTVNFHANNAVAKMGSNNRTAATVQAALMGLL